MTPDVVVDIGNTRMKWGLCRNGHIERMTAVQSMNPDAWTAKAEQWNLPHGTQWVVSFVNTTPFIPFVDWLNTRGDNIERVVNENLGLPVAVDEPDKVGIDRLLNSLAAVHRVPAGTPVVTVSVGTAMTVDFVNTDGIFIGGLIMPGPRTMAKSLRDYTDRLPLVRTESWYSTDYCGKNTVEAIQIGITAALTAAADQAILSFEYDMEQPVSVFITGGGCYYFKGETFAAETREIVIDKRLTLDGIRIAAEGAAVSDTTVSLLTPPGTGAIAKVEVRGPRVWELARKLFKPSGKPLPELPEVNRFWFGTLGSDEVILAACDCAVEIHCHGGPRVVRMVIDQFLANGCAEDRTPRPKGEGFDLLQRAPTLRTASIILDQLNGAFANEVRAILTQFETEPVAALRRLNCLKYLYTSIGEYLVEPWTIAFVGPPNVGKSSLVNALTGYQRSVVAEVAGTTRDAVSVRVAFDGWPMELIDTAGLRTAEGLEAEGIRLAKEVIAQAHALVWVVDATDPKARLPYLWNPSPRDGFIIIAANKCDLLPNGNREAYRGEDADEVPTVAVSAVTGAGLDELIGLLLTAFPRPTPGIAVPYTHRLYELLSSASDAARAKNLTDWTETNRLLRKALAIAESHQVG